MHIVLSSFVSPTQDNQLASWLRVAHGRPGALMQHRSTATDSEEEEDLRRAIQQSLRDLDQDQGPAQVAGGASSSQASGSAAQAEERASGAQVQVQGLAAAFASLSFGCPHRRPRPPEKKDTPCGGPHARWGSGAAPAEQEQGTDTEEPEPEEVPAAASGGDRPRVVEPVGTAGPLPSPEQQANCGRWYTVWQPGGLSGVHGGPRAWRAIESRLGGHYSYGLGHRLRKKPTRPEAEQLYADEATYHGVALTPQLFWWI